MSYLPGLKPVLEMLAKSPACISKIYCSDRRCSAEITDLQSRAEASHIPLERIPPQRLADFCGKQVAHQGVVAQLTETPSISLANLLATVRNAPLPLLLALDQVQDPGNLGAISRSAWALGCAGILLPKHNSAGISPAALKSSAGALAHLPVSICVNLARTLDECEEHGITIYGAASSPLAANALTFSWQLPAILVLGSEERGIRPGVAKRCHTLLAIPMARHFDSLNVAQAAGMLIALCAARQIIY